MKGLAALRLCASDITIGPALSLPSRGSFYFAGVDVAASASTIACSGSG